MSDAYDPPEAPPSVLGGPHPMLVLLLVLGAMLGWRFTVECLIGVGIVVFALASGVDPQTMANDPTSLLRADVLAIGTAVQLVGMVGVIAVCLRFVGWDGRRSFALGGTRGTQFVGAVIAGCVVGFFAGFINEKLVGLMPDGGLAMQEEIVKALTGGPLLGRVLMIGAVVIIAPIFEELAFRGGLWAAMERAAASAFGEDRRRMAELTAFIGTSLAFAAYHIDPVHVISLLPTAFLLGWLRYTSRSVWPGVVAHFLNNGLAAGLAHIESDPSQGLPWWGALISLAVTLAVCAGVATTSQPREET